MADREGVYIISLHGAVSPSSSRKNKKAPFISGGHYMRRSEKKELVQGESIRIRFSEKQKKRLFEEKSRTGRSVSDIVRQGVDEYFKRKT